LESGDRQKPIQPGRSFLQRAQRIAGSRLRARVDLSRP
jgi:hypothetical protein